ncbi:DUF6300 family protein [Nonomuraea sp. NPDC049480]|uniref:DUF6300 family protein n=1 Tax=Nonomuraea sp. NPDC049480 TaxID=3364353 RepID=UPI0037B4A550
MRTCPRCGGEEVLAVARVPHGWTTASGNRVRGSAEVVLCGRCDAADPAVACLRDGVTTETADRAARLLRRWMDRARPPRPDPAALEAELKAWRRGDL